MEIEDNNVTEEKTEKDNMIGILLTICAVFIFIIGFVLGILLRHIFIVWVSAFLIGMIFIAIAEIVNLLQDIYEKIGK